MHILILDDDKSYGALVASACKKLGHRAQVRFDPGAALSLLQDGTVDAVLLDLEMPQRPGTDVALWLRANGHELPIAFCMGTCQDQALIASAGAMAKVLPKVWTHADLKVILDSLDGERRDQQRKRQAPEGARASTMSGMGPPTFARGTGPGASSNFEHLPTEDILPIEARDPSDTIRTPAFVESADDAEPIQEPLGREAFLDDQTLDTASVPSSTMSTSVARALGELRRNVARVQINCPTWSLVRRLCQDLDRGQPMITVHGNQPLRVGDDVMVAVTLPDEMVVSMGGRVRDFRATEDSQKTAFAIELGDVGPEQTAYLLATCDLHSPPSVSAADASDAMMDTNPRIPVTKDSVDLDEGVYQGEARISWAKPPV